jgi:hypothetical protein
MQRITLAEATGWPLAELLEGGAMVDCLDFTPAQAKATAAAWAWLVGVKPGDGPAYEAARAEALSDGDIFVAVNLPPREFLEWWRRQDWELFPRSDNHGEGWAWLALDRVRSFIDSLGLVEASQIGLATLVARAGLLKG